VVLQTGRGLLLFDSDADGGADRFFPGATGIGFTFVSGGPGAALAAIKLGFFEMVSENNFDKIIPHRISPSLALLQASGEIQAGGENTDFYAIGSRAAMR
jgi:hypothetical protein